MTLYGRPFTDETAVTIHFTFNYQILTMIFLYYSSAVPLPFLCSRILAPAPSIRFSSRRWGAGTSRAASVTKKRRAQAPAEEAKVM